MNYKELAEQALDYIVEQRRWCHQNPEPVSYTHLDVYKRQV